MRPTPTILAAFTPWKRHRYDPTSPGPEAAAGRADAGNGVETTGYGHGVFGFTVADFVALQREMAVRAAAVSRAPVRVRRQNDVVVVELLDIPALLAVIDAGCRGTAWACGICLKPPRNPILPALRVAGLARSSPWGLVIRRDHSDPTVGAVSAALALHVSILRTRKQAAWRAIDAVRLHGTSTAASRVLGISPQAVAKQVRHNDLRATELTVSLITQLIPQPANAGDKGPRNLAVPF